MKNLSQRKERYMRDTVPVRLGGLAANLARIHSFSRNSANEQAVFHLFEESKHFIEWTAIETKPEIAAELAELQLQIAIWQLAWPAIWQNEERRNRIAASASEWSARVIESSGLLSQ